MIKKIVMKKKFLIITVILLVAVFGGCDGGGGRASPRDYREDMRTFVQGISAYAKESIPDFIVIPQNGNELLTEDGEATGAVAIEYINAIDGVGREDLFYGYDNDDVPTSASDTEYMISFLDIAEAYGVEAIVIDYCSTQDSVDDSYAQNALKGYTSFAANHRELDNIPSYPLTPYDSNVSDIVSLSSAKNFLYLLNASAIFADKSEFINAVKATDYDIIIMDAFFDGIEPFTTGEIASLKSKNSGGARKVIAYMSIGEAENYRYYWNDDWLANPPTWLAEENPDWPGNYKVRYWDTNWQDIIYGNDSSYLKKIINVGFDGVYLDIIDAFEYFEAQ